MSEFNCSLCNYTSDLKSNVERHIKKRTKCGEGIAEIIEIPVEIVCEFCSKTFTTRRSLNKHKKDSCRVKKSNIEEENRALKEKVEKLEEQIAKKPTNVTINNDNSTHNTHNTHNNIIINITPYNDPNLEGAEKYYLHAIKRIFLSVPTIIEKIHFNSAFPENHNICITNYRTKLAKVFTGREWKTMEEDQLISELVNTYENLLEDWAEDPEYPERMRYIQIYKEIKERDGRLKVEKEIRDEVKKLIYDKRGMIKIKN